MSPAFGLGIDFGTSNTVALMRWPDGRVRPLLFDANPLLPSAVFAPSKPGPASAATPAGGTVPASASTAAAPGGAAPAPGRSVIDELVVGGDALHHARFDPAGLEPNPKQHIDEQSILLGAREVAVTDLFAAVLRHVFTEARRVAGPGEFAVALAHPAGWGTARRAVLAEAARRAGLPAALLVPEPVAAAHAFTAVLGQQVPTGKALVVYDLGAGTFDASVVVRRPAGFEAVAVDGLTDVGGLDIDATIVRWLGERYSPADPELWARMTDAQDAESLRHRRMLWHDARVAKEMLSRAPAVVLQMPAPLNVDAQLTRDEFESAAKPLLERTVFTTAALIRQAGIAPDDVAGVLLVGGGSRIPLVATMLHRALGIAPTITEQPEVVVAEGCLLSLSAAPPADQAPGDGGSPLWPSAAAAAGPYASMAGAPDAAPGPAAAPGSLAGAPGSLAGAAAAAAPFVPVADPGAAAPFVPAADPGAAAPFVPAAGPGVAAPFVPVADAGAPAGAVPVGAQSFDAAAVVAEPVSDPGSAWPAAAPGSGQPGVAPVSGLPAAGSVSGPPGGFVMPPVGPASGPPGGYAAPPVAPASGPPSGYGVAPASGPPGGYGVAPASGAPGGYGVAPASGAPGGYGAAPASGPPGGYGVAPASGAPGGYGVAPASGPPGGYGAAPASGAPGGYGLAPASGPPGGYGVAPASGPPGGEARGTLYQTGQYPTVEPPPAPVVAAGPRYVPPPSFVAGAPVSPGAESRVIPVYDDAAAAGRYGAVRPHSPVPVPVAVPGPARGRADRGNWLNALLVVVALIALAGAGTTIYMVQLDDKPTNTSQSPGPDATSAAARSEDPVGVGENVATGGAGGTTPPAGQTTTRAQTVAVPDVLWLYVDYAKQKVQEAGFKHVVKQRTVDDEDQVGKVVAQDPQGHKQVTKGSTVTLWVGVAAKPSGSASPTCRSNCPTPSGRA